MPSQLFECPGAILALVLLWHFSGRKPFVNLRWFAILPAAVVGATVAGFIPAYRTEAALAAMTGWPIDVASVSGTALGGGIVTGGLVGVVALIANVMKRRERVHE